MQIEHQIGTSILLFEWTYNRWACLACLSMSLYSWAQANLQKNINKKQYLLEKKEEIILTIFCLLFATPAIFCMVKGGYMTCLHTTCTLSYRHSVMLSYRYRQPYLRLKCCVKMCYSCCWIVPCHTTDWSWSFRYYIYHKIVGNLLISWVIHLGRTCQLSTCTYNIIDSCYWLILSTLTWMER